jgi:ribose transport system ATP-binding protein
MPIIRMHGMVKAFGGTRAVDGVDFEVWPGEVHALLGGNGAGKSTLIKLLAGVHRADAGQISIFGKNVDPFAEGLPVAFIHQDLGLVEWMSVAENIALAAGYPRKGAGWIDWAALTAQAKQALAQVGCPIDPATPVSDLSRTDQSVVAIARALATEAEAVVLDEPTASLPAAEVERLFLVLGRMRAAGRGMVYVSHRLDEIFRIADRVTVMRDGRRIATKAVAETSPAELVELIVGRTPARVARRQSPAAGAPLLAGRGIVTAEAGLMDFALQPGEIIGFAGLRGAGQDSVGRCICGIVPRAGGKLFMRGRPVNPLLPADAVGAGIAFVSSKRQEESLAMALSVRENLFINPAVERRSLLTPMTEPWEAGLAMARLRAVGARPLATEPAIATFSGGNQQKVVLSRWLGGTIAVLVLEEPTMGVDVGAKADIYALLGRHAAEGGGVIVVSTDFEEVAAICDRALIFDRGLVSGELAGAALTAAGLIGACGGAKPTLAEAAVYV